MGWVSGLDLGQEGGTCRPLQNVYWIINSGIVLSCFWVVSELESAHLSLLPCLILHPVKFRDHGIWTCWLYRCLLARYPHSCFCGASRSELIVSSRSISSPQVLNCTLVSSLLFCSNASWLICIISDVLEPSRYWRGMCQECLSFIAFCLQFWMLRVLWLCLLEAAKAVYCACVSLRWNGSPLVVVTNLFCVIYYRKIK